MSENTTLLRLRDRSIIPPCGLIFNVAETKKRIVGGDIDGLIRLVRQHLKANNIPQIPNLAAIIEDQICRRLSPQWIAGAVVPHRTGFGGNTLNAKVATLERVWREIGAMCVDKPEAERRAAICRHCRLNKPAGCLSCNGVYGWLVQKFRVPRLADDNWLHVCAIGKIYNKAQVHLAPEVFFRLVPKTMLSLFPPACWKYQLLSKHYDKESEHESEAKTS